MTLSMTQAEFEALALSYSDAWRTPPSLPTDWCAAVFGRQDIRDRLAAHELDALGHLVAGYEDPILVDGVPKELGLLPPIWRSTTYMVDRVFGRTDIDGALAFVTPQHLREERWREAAVMVAPLGYFDVATTPSDFNAKELAAKAYAADVFTSGAHLLNGHFTDGTPFWPDTFDKPAAARQHTWESLRKMNTPLAVLVNLHVDGTFTIDRVWMSIVAAARELSLREVPIRVLYA